MICKVELIFGEHVLSEYHLFWTIFSTSGDCLYEEVKLSTKPHDLTAWWYLIVYITIEWMIHMLMFKSHCGKWTLVNGLIRIGKIPILLGMS